MKTNNHLINSYINYIFFLYSEKKPEVPEFMINRKEDLKDEDEDVDFKINEKFEFTEDVNDLVCGKIVKEFMKSINLKSYSVHLINKGSTNIKKRVDRKETRFWNKLKLKK